MSKLCDMSTSMLQNSEGGAVDYNFFKYVIAELRTQKFIIFKVIHFNPVFIPTIYIF
jgi:hypothetical protein